MDLSKIENVKIINFSDQVVFEIVKNWKTEILVQMPESSIENLIGREAVKQLGRRARNIMRRDEDFWFDAFLMFEHLLELLRQ